jgi:hypothetical protein
MSNLAIEERGQQFDTLMPLLEAMFRQFQDAAKKKPDAVLNKQKVLVANRLLVSLLGLLDGEPTRAFLDVLDEDDLPQNSDVVLMLGQALAAMQAFKKKHYKHLAGHGYVWVESA